MSSQNGSGTVILNDEFKETIRYRPFAVDRLNTNVGERPIAGIPYLRAGHTPFDSNSKLSRDMVLNRGNQNSARLGESSSLPSRGPGQKKSQEGTGIQGGESQGGEGLTARHFGLQAGSGQVGAGLFDSLIRKVAKSIKSVAKDVKGAVKVVDKFVSKPDLLDRIGREIGKGIKIAEDEIKKDAKAVAKSAKRGTILSDGLMLIAKGVDKYGASAAGILVSSIVASAGGGLVSKQIGSQVAKAITNSTGADHKLAGLLNKLGKQAKQKGFGDLQPTSMHTRGPGHDRKTIGRPDVHFSHMTANRLTTGDDNNRGARGSDKQSFVATHPLNFRRAKLTDVA